MNNLSEFKLNHNKISIIILIYLLKLKLFEFICELYVNYRVNYAYNVINLYESINGYI